MFLARTVFHCTLAELKERLTEEEFCLWMAYYDIDPWGNEWYQTGTIAASILQGKSTKQIKPDEFIPYRYPEDRPSIRHLIEKKHELDRMRARQVRVTNKEQAARRDKLVRKRDGTT